LYKIGMTKTAEDLRYPIGRFRAVMPVTSELRSAAIDAIAGLPDLMRAAVADLTTRNSTRPIGPTAGRSGRSSITLPTVT
jgi:hypothetical protein